MNDNQENDVCTKYNEESSLRTWGAYPEIQKEFPYSDQCIAALIHGYRTQVLHLEKEEVS